MQRRAALEHNDRSTHLTIRERPRRLRAHLALRDALAETSLRPAHLVLPVFALEGSDRAETIPSLPGHSRLSSDRLVRALEPLVDAGLTQVMVFGVPDVKTPDARSLHDVDGPAQSALRALRDAFGDRITTWADVCLCPHADHGHCGVPSTDRTGRTTIDGDAALPLLAKGAVSLAESGADWVAPSDMMDGRVGHLRRALDAAGHKQTGIVSYTAKYASALYGPFRDAVGSAPAFGDRRTYQMDPRNAQEALREARLDVAEGADVLMVKPALLYLDVLARMRDAVDVPLAAYHVSGEYAMAHAAAERGWLDRRAVLLESLVAIRRAGASLVLSYATQDALQEGWL